MTGWTQYHPTQTLTTPDGQRVGIDVKMVPLVTQLWRLGFATKVACQDAGEAIQEGGTRAAPADRPAAAARNMGRAWLVVRREDGPRLLKIWACVGAPDDWMMQPVKKDTDPDGWVSITFPRRLIETAVQALRPLPTNR